ncbi:MAG: hypothetical protein SF053_18420 [Bacteroidia bacterium]|nr:hypothetical protein [Bacteroidia bacterium]
MNADQKAIIKLVGILSVFLIPFIPLNIYVFQTSPFFAKQQKYHTTIENFFTRPNAKVLIAGDSHPEVLDNKFLNEEAYNISSGGDGLKEVYVKLKYVLERPNQVKTLLLTTDPHMVGRKRINSANKSFLNAYVLRIWDFKIYGKDAASVSSDMVPLFNDSYMEYLNQKIKDVFSGATDKRQLYEDLRQDHSLWGSDRFTQEERVGYAIKTGRSDFSGVLEDTTINGYYRRIFQLCQEHNIQVYGVKYPAMNEYLAQLDPADEQKLNTFFSQLPFAGMLDYRKFPQEPRFYKNEDHVNDAGALILLGRLETDLGYELSGVETPAYTDAQP